MKYLILLSITLSFNTYSQIHRIKSLDLDSNDKQFRLLSKITKNAKVIGLGESAHGVKEYAQARTRLIKYLIEKENFRLIVNESGYYSTEKINDYLMKCTNEAPSLEALDKLMSTVGKSEKTQESKEMINWLCQFNTKNQESVRFHGIDQWETPWTTRNLIHTGVKLYNDQKINTLYENLVENCFAWKANSWDEARQFEQFDYVLQTWRLDPEKHRQCVGSLHNIQRALQKITKDNEVTFWMKTALRVSMVYQKYRNLYVMETSKALNLRDDLQAYLTLRWVYKYESKKKAILLAHNIHISKKQSDVIPRFPGEPYKWVNVISTGQNLVAHFGNKYKAIAITGFDVQSSRAGQYPLPDDEESLDLALSNIGDILLVNPKTKWISKQDKWWMHTEGHKNGMYLSPQTQYDGIFFIKEAISVTPL